MHSFIICGGNSEVRQAAILKQLHTISLGKPLPTSSLADFSDPDIHVLRPDPSISIEMIRELQSRLKLKPFYRESKAAVVLDANLLTLPAQQALLKTLEEPTPNTFIILELESPYRLLPTIRSRCQLIRVPDHTRPAVRNPDLLHVIISGSPGKRLQYLKNLSEREQQKQFLLELLVILRHQLKENPAWSSALRATHEALRDLEANLNPQLVLEHYVLSLPRLQPNTGGKA